MTSADKKKLMSLKRRRDFLAQRVANYKGRDPSHDKAELGALNWAISLVENADRAGVLDDIGKGYW